MLENINTSPNSRDDGAGTPENYLSRAVAACEAGDARLGLHLYLAAFEQAAEQSDAPSEDAIMGLKQAWRVACSTKERALAEYIFERLEPYLSDDEVQACVEQLQVLAMERLEGIGLSGDDLMEMTEALSGDFMEMVGPMMAAAVHGEDAAMAQAEALAAPSGAAPAGEEASQPVDIFSYDSISGYGAAVARMRSLGVGLAGTPEFDDFVAMLNSRHGLDAMPVVDSLLFCSPAREDASRFMLATVGELGLPAIRMRMEETFQGVPMLCVSAQATDAEKLASLRHGFAGPGILVLEDLDLWGAPVIDAADDMAGFFMAAMSRGAREAVNLIRPTSTCWPPPRRSRPSIRSSRSFCSPSPASISTIPPLRSAPTFGWISPATTPPSDRWAATSWCAFRRTCRATTSTWRPARPSRKPTSRALWNAATFRCPARTFSTSSPPTSRSIPPSTPSSSASSSPTSPPPWAI